MIEFCIWLDYSEVLVTLRDGVEKGGLKNKNCLILCNHYFGVFPLDVSFNECMVSCGHKLSKHSLLWRFDCDLEF